MNPCSGIVTMPVKVRFLSETCPPEKFNYATSGSAGIDLRACMAEAEVLIPPGGRHRFPTGIAVECTMPGVAGFVYSRSGLGTKDGLVVSQGVGVIDPDYRGEILVSLLNTSDQTRIVTRGQRIAQLVFQPVVRAEIIPQENLSDTARGAGGFGHTGTI
ncbi:MAG: dUTP diphosphatase [Desulfomicrobium apsheronum]|nr:dUTP diphosphatase [Desulfomicrobium apsheronum]